MALTVPPFIQRAGIADAPVGHRWDDTDPEFAYVTMDARLQRRIGETTHRGVLAVSAGLAEWIAWRFHKLCDEPLLFHKIEAMWAGLVDWRYLSGARLPEQHQWHGPVRGPIWAAANWLDRIVDLLKREQFASPEAACLSDLVRHVIPRLQPFTHWRRFAIVRLAKLYPKDRQDMLGSPIPRQVLDPDVSYDALRADALIDSFLRGLDTERNPFLSSPTDMVAKGFTGTPYTFL
jgi:hypothetical protein